MASQRFGECHKCVCGYEGLLADHLRESMECVEDLRKRPELQMTAPDDEVFIVKAIVLLRGCPAPNCPGGAHQQLPQNCLFWWKNIGWVLMAWKGSSENANTAAIKKKESMFRRNFLRKDRQPLRNDQSQQVEQDRADVDCCQFCQQQGQLVHHLHQSSRCLRAYLQLHLPTRGHLYIGKTGLAVFDLGLLMRLCSNPNCLGSLCNEGFTRHLQGGCLEYFLQEGKKLFHWDGNINAGVVAKKLRDRKSYLILCGREAGDYDQKLGEILKIACFYCNLRGPLLSASEHQMSITNISHPPGGMQWICSKCKEGDDKHKEMVLNAAEKLKALGTPGEHDDTMKKIVVGDPSNGTERVVFVPASMAVDIEARDISDALLNPRNTTVLVPKEPEALDQIGDEASERANAEKDSLENVAEFMGRRFFFGPVTECVSVLYRLKIAQIRVERLMMLKSLSKTSKGMIESRNPNMAAVRERNPHFAMTQQFCLTNSCSWSPGAQHKRSDESAARACVNGSIKIKIDMTVLKQLAMDSPHLRDILCGLNGVNGPTSLLSSAPLALNYLKAKVNLIVKHGISQAYDNWDLELRFAEQEWTVYMVGFLFCKGFDELNRKIAHGEISEETGLRAAGTCQTILPTTTTSVNRLVEVYSIAEEDAQVKLYLFLDTHLNIHCHCLCRKLWH